MAKTADASCDWMSTARVSSTWRENAVQRMSSAPAVWSEISNPGLSFYIRVTMLRMQLVISSSMSEPYSLTAISTVSRLIPLEFTLRPRPLRG